MSLATAEIAASENSAAQNRRRTGGRGSSRVGEVGGDVMLEADSNVASLCFDSLLRANGCVSMLLEQRELTRFPRNLASRKAAVGCFVAGTSGRSEASGYTGRSYPD